MIYDYDIYDLCTISLYHPLSTVWRNPGIWSLVFEVMEFSKFSKTKKIKTHQKTKEKICPQNFLFVIMEFELNN